MKLVNFLRKLIATPFLAAMVFTVTFGIPFLVIINSFTDRATIKHWLIEGKIYENAKESILWLIMRGDISGQNNKLRDILLTVQESESENGSIIDLVLNPTTLQNHAETLIDATYDWMEGKTERPTFAIKVIDNPQLASQLLILGLKTKLESLEECTTPVVVDDQAELFSLSCRPKELTQENIDMLIESSFSDPETAETFLKEFTITSDMLTITSTTTLKVRIAYELMKKAMWIVISIGLFSVLMLVILIPGFWIAIKTVGIELMLNSGLLIIVSLLFLIKVNDLYILLSSRLPEEYAQLYASYGNPLAGTIGRDIATKIILYAGVVFNGGLVTILTGKIAEVRQLRANRGGVGEPSHLNA